MKILSFLVAAAAAQTALAECPPSPAIADRMDPLLEAVQAAPNEAAARAIAPRMWALWTEAPDARAQDLLDEGMERRAVFDLGGARAAFDALIAYCPDYAEGYNQRAFVNFIAGEHAAALPDLDRAIELSPRHVAAIAGKGLTLIAMGRIGEGQEAIRQAVALNPWLSERRLLEMRPGPGGDEIEL